MLELALFGLAAWALHSASRPLLALILAGLTVVHYVISYDRAAWLLRQKGAGAT